MTTGIITSVFFLFSFPHAVETLSESQWACSKEKWQQCMWEPAWISAGPKAIKTHHHRAVTAADLLGRNAKRSVCLWEVVDWMTGKRWSLVGKLSWVNVLSLKWKLKFHLLFSDYFQICTRVDRFWIYYPLCNPYEINNWLFEPCQFAFRACHLTKMKDFSTGIDHNFCASINWSLYKRLWRPPRVDQMSVYYLKYFTNVVLNFYQNEAGFCCWPTPII